MTIQIDPEHATIGELLAEARRLMDIRPTPGELLSDVQQRATEAMWLSAKATTLGATGASTGTVTGNDPVLIDGGLWFWLGQFAVDGGYDRQAEIEHRPCGTIKTWTTGDMSDHSSGALAWFPEMLLWALNHRDDCPLR